MILHSDLLIPAGGPGVIRDVDALVDPIQPSRAGPTDGLLSIAPYLLLPARAAGKGDLTACSGSSLRPTGSLRGHSVKPGAIR